MKQINILTGFVSKSSCDLTLISPVFSFISKYSLAAPPREYVTAFPSGSLALTVAITVPKKTIKKKNKKKT